MQTKKITIICKHLANGGAERVMSELITAFHERGHKVQVITLFNEKNFAKNIEYDIPDGVELVEMKWKPNKRLLQGLIHNSELRKRIKGDYIISMLYPATEISIIAGKLLKKPVIVSERNYPKVSPPTRKGRLIRNFSFRFADTCVFQTTEAKKYFSKSIQNKGVIIPNPISENLPERFSGTREKKIAVVGRLEKQKNHPMMLRTFKRFLKNHPDYELHIFSRGPLLNELQNYAKELGIDDKVFFEGFVENVNSIIRTYSMYVSTSDYEGISNSMLEALAIGLPTICTDCPVGGAKEAIKNNVNGILIPVRDEKALLKAMNRLVDDSVFSEELGIEATKIKKKYTTERIINRWLALLN